MVTVGFSTSSALVSRLIRWVTRSKVSHAWIGLDMYGMRVIVQASVGGVKVLPRSTWEKGNNLVAEFGVVPDIHDGLRHTLSLLGQKYDYLGLFGFLKVALWKRWFKKKVKNPFASARSLVCSEFVVHLANRGELPEWGDLDPEGTTPHELWERCETGPSFEPLEYG